MTRVLALTLALAGLSSPALAQLSAGGGIAGYDLYAVDGSGEWLGRVLVLPLGISNIPKYFADDTEYWYIRPDKGWQSEFMMVEMSNPSFPSSDPNDYYAYDHDHFDLSTPISFPSTGSGLSYGVYDASLSLITYGWSGGGLGSSLAWFNFTSTDQEAWGTNTLYDTTVGPLSGMGLLWVNQSLPAKGSVTVYEGI